jgi:hypothetical protein
MLKYLFSILQHVICMLIDQESVTTGINSFFAALAGSLPNTTFAQNNGVLALTRCASRTAGYSCGIWLFLFGVLAKVTLGSITTGAFLVADHMPAALLLHRTFAQNRALVDVTVFDFWLQLVRQLAVNDWA